MRQWQWQWIVAAGLAALLAGCSANSGPQSTDIATIEAAAPTVSLAISPVSLQVGQSATASWDTSADTACVSSGAWTGPAALSNTGMTIGPFNTAGTYSYGMTCTGPGGSTAVNQTVMVGAVPAPTIQFELIPSAITPGSSALIVWSTTDANSCVGSSGAGSDGWQGTQPTVNAAGFNTGSIQAEGQFDYDLTCLGPGGSTQATRILSVSAASPAPVPGVSLAAQPAFIAPGQSVSLRWSTSDATSCAASGGTGSDAWSGSQPVVSTGTVIGPISQAGTYSYTLTCAGPGGSHADSATIVVSTSTQPPTVTLNIDVAPAQIVAGGSADLTWSSSNTDACTAAGSWSGNRPLLGSAVSTGTLSTAAVYSYTLTCSGPGGSTTGTAILQVNPAPATVSSFSAAATALQTGQSAVLSWASAGATSCAASGGSGSAGWNGVEPTGSSGTSVGPITVAGTYVLTLVCTGPGGTGAPQSVTIAVANPSPATAGANITSFRAMPNTVLTGQTATLTWSTSGASSCIASGGAGSGWAGAQPTASSGTTIGPLNTAGNVVYTLTCSGAGGAGAPDSVTVDVDSAPPPATVDSFTATPNSVQAGQSTLLAWSSGNATSCTATGGTGSDGWSGPVATASSGTSIGPESALGTENFTLTCTGPGGSSAPSTLGVMVSSTPPAATITNFNATPSAVQTGQAITLMWSTGNATACTASGGTGSDGWNGSVPTSSSGTRSGALGTAGSYTYTLTCTGPGGTSVARSATVTVTTAPPPATIATFTATPSTLLTGQSTLLAWSTNAATSCTAGGGTGADGWSGAVAVSSTGTTAGPINTAGSTLYTLTCTGPGGSSAPASINVNASTVPPAASILSFTAMPGTLQAGQSTSLAWTTSNATSCTASGGSGSDGWGGARGTSSTGTSAGPLSTGTVTYTLTCTGSGGTGAPSSVNVTVNPASSAQPTVTLLANGSNSAQIQPGASFTLSWSSSHATSCAASGGTGSDGWAGSRSISGAGLVLGPIGTPGIYSYTLTCTGAGGTGSSSVQLTVIASTSFDCGIPGLATAALVTPAASVTTSKGGLCVLDCTVLNPGNVIDSIPGNYASIDIPLALLGTVSLEVTDTATFPAGRQAGFVVSNGSSLLDAALLGGITVETLASGMVQETATVGNLLSLQAAGLLSVDQYAGFVGFTTTKSFDSVELVTGSLASVDTNLKVYDACVSQQ